MDQQFEDRLATLERALTDGETDLEAVAQEAATAEQVADLEDRLGRLADEVADLDAATQALRGYVGEVRSVNEEVEETAAAAMAKAERAQAAADGEPRSPACGAADPDPPSGGTQPDESDQPVPGADGRQDVGSGSGVAAAPRSNDEEGCADPVHSRPRETDDTHPSWAGGPPAEDWRVHGGSPSDRCPACGREDTGDFRPPEGPAPPRGARDDGTGSVPESGQFGIDRGVPEPAHQPDHAHRTDSDHAHRTGSDHAHRTEPEWSRHTESEAGHRTDSEPHHEGTSSRHGRSGTARGRSDAGLLARIRERL